MSARNRRDEKKLRALRRSLHKGRIPSYIDLRDWLRLRGYASSNVKAEAIIAEERVRSDSHVLGFKTVTVDGEEVKLLDPRVPARLRGSITVLEV